MWMLAGRPEDARPEVSEWCEHALGAVPILPRVAALSSVPPLSSVNEQDNGQRWRHHSSGYWANDTAAAWVRSPRARRGGGFDPPESLGQGEAIATVLIPFPSADAEGRSRFGYCTASTGVLYPKPATNNRKRLTGNRA